MADDNNHPAPHTPVPWRHSGLRWQAFTTLTLLGVPISIAGGISLHTPLIAAGGTLAVAAALVSIGMTESGS